MIRSLARRRIVLAACAVPCAAGVGLARAQGQGLGLARESAVKAAFLYKFGAFVEWPAGAFRSPQSAFVIGVYGDEAVASELEQITQGRNVGDRRVEVLRVRAPEDIRGLHLLYAGGARESRARELLEAVRGPVLTVANAPLTGQAAPVLHFSEEQGRVRFGASLPAAAARGLRLSSRLLAVAHHVETLR